MTGCERLEVFTVWFSLLTTTAEMITLFTTSVGH